MELCSQSLETWIWNRNMHNPLFQKEPSAVRDAKIKFYSIMSGLEYIHSQNIIHRGLWSPMIPSISSNSFRETNILTLN